MRGDSGEVVGCFAGIDVVEENGLNGTGRGTTQLEEVGCGT